MALPALTSAHCSVLNRADKSTLYSLDPTGLSWVASLTKLWSLHCIVRSGYADEAALNTLSVTVDADSNALGGSGASDSNAGDIWPGFACLQGALIPSSSELTDALERHVAVNDLGYTGTTAEVRAAIVAAMNTSAAAAGMSNTTYTDHYGLSTTTRSTSADQALMMDLVCDWPAVRSAWLTAPFVQVTIERNGQPWIEGLSSSSWVWADTGVIGLKNGIGGGTHLATLWTAPSGDEIVIVTLNSDQGMVGVVDDHRAIMAQLPIDYPALSDSPPPPPENDTTETKVTLAELLATHASWPGGVTNEEARDWLKVLINRPRGDLTGDDLFKATDATEWTVLTPDAKALWMAFCNRPVIDPYAAANVAFAQSLFGGGSNTITALNALRDETVPRWRQQREFPAGMDDVSWLHHIDRVRNS